MIVNKAFSEDNLAAQFFLWAWNTYPALHRKWFHVPNEQERLPGESVRSHMRRITTLKAKGMVPGVWDYICLTDDGKYSLLELKVGGNDLSKLQEKFRDAVRYKHALVAWTLEEAQEAFKIIFGVD